MDILSVASFDKYQHYKERHMLWFKLYVDILQDEQFMELSEKDRWVFLGMICLACKTDNKIARNEKWLERTLNTSNIKKSLENLICINLLSTCYQSADYKEIRREEKRGDDIDSKQQAKVKYLDFVYLTPEQHESLVARFGVGGAGSWIERVNTYANKIGERKFRSKYASHYHVILEWYGADVKAGKIHETRPTDGNSIKALEERAAKQLEGMRHD